ncbi:putative isomerase YddE [Abditibacteriota bacterium]|nr:putative isomerase YddE [Abditibacteriota bacterium]
MDRAPFYLIDAFTESGKVLGHPLRGNPAAVVLLDEFASDAWMQERANEFNLSETAFVVGRGDQNFDLRWFTPQVEVDLCGHATLATAAALLDAGQILRGDNTRFSTRSGILTAKVVADRIELDFPGQQTSARAILPQLRSALGLKANEILYCGRAADDWFVRVAPDKLGPLRPDFKKLALIEARGVVVTTHAPPGEESYDFASRFFGPRVGIDEDPVTGSAHTALAPFWAARLGKMQLKAVQLSARGGWLEVEVRGLRVAIIGQAQIRAQGHLRD